MKPPASKWLVAPGPRRASHCSPIKGMRHFARCGCIDTGRLQANCTYTSRWSCRLAPTAGTSATTSMPWRASRSAGPTPDSCRSWGELMEAAAADHLAGLHGSGAAALDICHARGPGALEEDPRGEGTGDEMEVAPAQHGMQVGPGRAEAAAPVNVAVEGGEALLAVAVDVGGATVARLLGGLQEGLEQRG